MANYKINKRKTKLRKNKNITIQDLNIISLQQKNNQTNNLVFINGNIKQEKKEELKFKLNLDKLKI